MRALRLGASAIIAIVVASTVLSGAAVAEVQTQAAPGAPGAGAAGYQFVRWDRRPIKLHLKVGAERIVWFPGGVQPGVPPALAQKVRVQANGDTVYFKAGRAFPETRFPVRDLASGRIYLLDVTASENGSAEPVRVLLNEDRDHRGIDESETESAATPPSARQHQDYTYVDLTRFAAKQFYAPERLAEILPGVFRASLSAAPTTALIRGSDTLATPLASWRAPNGLTVTAVRIKNMRKESVTWDPRRLRGDWLTASSQHRTLSAAGTPSDATVIYLVSAGSFEEAASPWLSR